MSFFFEARRTTDFPIKHGPSPSHYNTLRDHKKLTGYAPFGTTSKLNRTAKQQKKIPQNNINQQQKQPLFDEIAMKQMIQDQMAAVFKSRSQRFISSYRDGPGPGAYQVSTKNNNKHKQKSVMINESRVNIKHTTPSMPLDSLGYKYDKNSNPQKVKGKSVEGPKPGSYELRKDLVKQNGLCWKNDATKSKKQPEEPLPGPGQYNSETKSSKAPTSCFNSKIDRFNQKTIRKSYKPGPGDYNPTQTQPIRQLSESHFNSKAMRFKPSMASALGPGAYFQDKSKSLKNFKKNYDNKAIQNKSLLQPNRKTIFSLHNKNPGPGQYMARDGMTFQLQKALLRKHNLSQFANSKRQIFAPKDDQQPGPGAYNPQIPKNNPKGSLSGYKKVEVVNLKENDDDPQPSPFDYTNTNYTIQKKVYDSGKKLTLTEKKPFDSGAQRFKHYNTKNEPYKNRYQTYDTDNQSIEDGNYQKTGFNFEDSTLKKTKKLIMTSVKVKVPFGSSASKYADKYQEQPGPGAYGNNTNSKWLKQTFNIKGKVHK